MENPFYHYLIGLRLVNPSPQIDFREDPWNAGLLRAVSRYNDNSSTYNQKQIEVVQTGRNNLLLALRSSNKLSMPGRALRFFSQCIAQDPAFSGMEMPNGRVFDTFPATSLPEDAGSVVLPGNISDKVFLQALIAFFLDPSGEDIARRKRKAITEMKALALSSGIIPTDAL